MCTKRQPRAPPPGIVHHAQPPGSCTGFRGFAGQGRCSREQLCPTERRAAHLAGNDPS